MTYRHSVIMSIAAAAGLAGAAGAQPVVFSTNGPNLLMGAAARSETANAVEIEPADDFVLASDTRLTGATITGLIPHGAALKDIQSVVVQIYRVFPLDSNAVRIPHVPTRTNSPGDNAFTFRDADTGLTFTARALDPKRTALNSVVNGINPSPSQTTLGEGPVTGDEVEIHVKLAVPIDLLPGHYFFVPQVTLNSGDFLWLSAPKPIVAPGTPFTPDLQAWIRSGRLNPDWLRIGGDIVGGSPAPAFNMVFMLEGTAFCYANCDESTTAPVLNVLDFKCFLNSFAAGLPYANCDKSTTPPVLNVLDFGCFLNKFAAGCS